MNTFLLVALVFFLLSGTTAHSIAGAIVKTPAWENDEGWACAFGCLSIVYALFPYVVAGALFVTLCIHLN